MSTPWYCTRETVKRALDVAETARSNGQVDRAIAGSTDQVWALTHRRFYPTVATRYFDGPARDLSGPTVLYLGQHELISATSVTVDGDALTEGVHYVLRPEHGPPYTRLEILDDSSLSLVSGQRKITIVGEVGSSATSVPAGALSEAIDATETGVDITDSGMVGVGDLLLVGSERMIVTGKAMADTGVDIDAGDSLTASAADVSILCSTTTGIPQVDETILIDSERMLVVDIAGPTLTVKRAWDGSVLATHAAGASIWAPRTLTVERGALGTTAAAHDTATAIRRHTPPAIITNLAVAESMCTLLNEGSGYARVAGSGDNAREYWGRALDRLTRQAQAAYGRTLRTGAI